MPEPLRVAFVTYRQLPDGSDDDRRAFPDLAALGVTAVPAVWDDPHVRWETFDALVLRSTWDYFLRPDEFDRWLAAAARVSAVWNAPRLVRWNANKRYLLDLAAGGARVVPTVVFDRRQHRTLRGVLERSGWSEAVVKPAVGGNAEGLRRVAAPVGPDDERHLERLAARGDVLVQPFQAEVGPRGERSLVFLGGEFSHAVRYPFVLNGGDRAGAPVEPEPALRAAAERLVRGVPEPTLYARVDFLPSDEGGWVLSELELIEPDLFLRVEPAAPRRFAAAIRACLARGGRASPHAPLGEAGTAPPGG